MKLKIGIIGLGVGEAHIKGYQSHPDCEVVALCDFSDEKCSIAKKRYRGMTVTKNADDILRDPVIDVVSIASYDNYHYEQIVKAINNRKHIFIEKPLCLYEKEAKHISVLLKKYSGLKMSSNLILRKCPRFRWLKEKIKRGGMGKIFHLEGDYNFGRLAKLTQGWRGAIKFYSMVYGGGVHLVDLLLWLTQDRVVEVAAYGNNITTKGTQFHYNDSVTAILKFKSGMTGKISVHGGCVRPHFHGLSVYGTKATFVNDLTYGLLYTSADSKLKAKKLYESYPGVEKGDLIYNFVDSIVNNAQPEISAKDVFASMSVCFAIEKAVSSNCRVKVQYINQG